MPLTYLSQGLQWGPLVSSDVLQPVLLLHLHHTLPFLSGAHTCTQCHVLCGLGTRCPWPRPRSKTATPHKARHWPLVVFAIPGSELLHQAINLLGFSWQSEAREEQTQSRHKLLTGKVYLVHICIHDLNAKSADKGNKTDKYSYSVHWLGRKLSQMRQQITGTCT